MAQVVGILLLMDKESISKHNLLIICWCKQSGHPQSWYCPPIFQNIKKSKANLRDLIAATGLVILLKFDPKHQFFSLWDLEIWLMTSKNDRAHPLYYIKLCSSFQIHRWIQTEVPVWKPSLRDKIGDFLSCVNLKFDGRPWKTIGHLFCTISSFMHHFKAMGEFKLKLQSRSAQFRPKSATLFPVWPRNLMDDLGKQ